MLATLVLAASGITTCPTTIIDRQSIVAAPPGWESRTERSEHELKYADVQWGPPPVSGPTKSLKPEEREPGAFVWALGAKLDHWVVCHYRDTAVVLIRRVERPKDCTFTEGRHDASRWQPASMVCRPAD